MILNFWFNVLDDNVQSAKLAHTMKKKDAIRLFGSTQEELGKALGGRGKSAISQWPDDLSEDQKNMVIGAAVRRGIKIPKELLRI